jgi:hypothetical protein
MEKIRTYGEMCQFDSWEERLEYLRLAGRIGVETFGYERVLNQQFYQSVEWRSIRNQVILRDNGCDLGLPGHEIFGQIYVHHMNPLLPDDLLHHSDNLMNPDYLVCVTLDTHNAIHYGREIARPLVTERRPGDTCPWRN